MQLEAVLAAHPSSFTIPRCHARAADTAPAAAVPPASESRVFTTTASPLPRRAIIPNATHLPGGGRGGGATTKGLVEATSQVSRFHLETLEIVSAKGLDLPGVQLSVDSKTLLEDAHLQLKAGVRYGLIGR